MIGCHHGETTHLPLLGFRGCPIFGVPDRQTRDNRIGQIAIHWRCRRDSPRRQPRQRSQIRHVQGSEKLLARCRDHKRNQGAMHRNVKDAILRAVGQFE